MYNQCQYFYHNPFFQLSVPYCYNNIFFVENWFYIVNQMLFTFLLMKKIMNVENYCFAFILITFFIISIYNNFT